MSLHFFVSGLMFLFVVRWTLGTRVLSYNKVYRLSRYLAPGQWYPCEFVLGEYRMIGQERALNRNFAEAIRYPKGPKHGPSGVCFAFGFRLAVAGPCWDIVTEPVYG